MTEPGDWEFAEPRREGPQLKWACRPIARLLATLGEPTVHRSMLRCLLWTGETKAQGGKRRVNRTTKHFGEALRQLEELGHIRREAEVVHVLDASALMTLSLDKDFRLEDLPLSACLAESLTALDDEQLSAASRALRERQVVALRGLIEDEAQLLP